MNECEPQGGEGREGKGGVAVGRALIEEDAVTSAALALYKSPRWWFLATSDSAVKRHERNQNSVLFFIVSY